VTTHRAAPTRVGAQVRSKRQGQDDEGGGAVGDACTGDDIPFYQLFDQDPSAPDLSDHVAGFLNLCSARSLLEETLDRHLRASAGITLAQHEVLYRLSLAPGGRLRMAGLADMLLTSKSGCSRLVDRMTVSGLVAREPSTTDRRLVFAVLTPTGRTTLVRSAPIFRAGVTSAFGNHLDQDDHQTLGRILQKLLAAHDAWDVRRCEPPTTSQ
jgi:DNA-binding MarR family transcriptional regulator